jgi:CubicO group peptidase (beta-lactamase class C family)
MHLARRTLLRSALQAGGAFLVVGRRADALADDGLDAAVRREVSRLGHPGVCVAVVSRTVPPRFFSFGRRDVASGAPVQPDTVFRVASITKVFSGMALLQLRDAGVLELDDPIARWIPEAHALPRITLRHLVTHTSGLPRNVPDGATTEEALLAKLAATRPIAEPGARTAYSNLGMALAGPVVRRAGGRPYREWMASRVLGPLGMTGAAWEAAQVPPEKLATGYVAPKGSPAPRCFEPSPSEWRMGAAEAFGGLYASAEDMARFAAFELSAGADGLDAGLPLVRPSLRESQTQALVVPGDSARYGVCWKLEGPRLVHGGATDEYSAAVVLDVARGAGVAVLSNAAFEPEVEAAAKRVLDGIA